MKYTLTYSNEAQSQIDDLPFLVGKRIVAKLAHYTATNDPLQYATRLSGTLGHLYRFRIGDYRAIFELVHGTVTIIFVQKVAHRKDVYE
jgi:mRNA interferase RelE/StbE